MPLKVFIVLLSTLHLSLSDFATTIELVSLNVPDGTLANGKGCGIDNLCSLWVAVCVTSVESKSSCSYEYTLEDGSTPLTDKQNTITFDDGIMYGNWPNPNTISIITKDDSKFYIAFAIYNSNNPLVLVDQFALEVDKTETFVNYTHPRQYSGPTNVQFSLGATCRNGGTPVEGGQCVCTEHYTGNSCQTPICENGGTPAPDGSTCICPPNAQGDFCETYLSQNCYEIATHGDQETGVKTIYLPINDVLVPTSVYCNQGWTVVQQRVDGSLPFGKLWTEYAAGFGSPSDNGWFNTWFGNDNIYYLSQANPMAIRFNMKYCGDDGLFTSTYGSFAIGDSSTNYTITIAGYDSTSTGGDGSLWFTGSAFSTADVDNTKLKCARFYDNSGFWFNPLYCGSLSFIVPNLNGNYPGNCDPEVATAGILWTPLTGNSYTNHQSLGFSSIEVIPAEALQPGKLDFLNL